MNSFSQKITVLLFFSCCLLYVYGNSPKRLSPTIVQEKEWELFSLGKNTKLSLPQPAYVYFSNGRIKGHSGCNQFSANYSIDNEHISIAKIKQTKMFCAEISTLEEQFFQALESSQRWTVKKSKLILKDAHHKRLCVFINNGQTELR